MGTFFFLFFFPLLSLLQKCNKFNKYFIKNNNGKIKIKNSKKRKIFYVLKHIIYSLPLIIQSFSFSHTHIINYWFEFLFPFYFRYFRFFFSILCFFFFFFQCVC